MRLSDRLQGLCAQSWAKTGLGKKPYNTKKYGNFLITSRPYFRFFTIHTIPIYQVLITSGYFPGCK